MKVGFIGLGRMGQAMASRLLAGGHEVMVYNRTAGKSAALVAQGALEASSVLEVAQHGNVTLSMLADDAALRSVCEGAGGLIASLPAGGTHVVMGTHDVDLIRALGQEHARNGRTLIAAPMLGRPEAVAAGRASVIVAGDAATVEVIRPLFDSIGRRVFPAGADPGAASAVKLANNFLLACAIEAMGEAFSLVQKSGVDANIFHELIVDGPFACPAYASYAKIIAEKSWDKVGFTVALGLKDVSLVLAAGTSASVPLPSANVCRDRLLSAIAHGDRDKDWSAMAHEQARACGLDD